MNLYSIFMINVREKNEGISLYIIKRFRHRRRVKNREGGGGGRPDYSKSP